jgi:transaldolase
LIRLNQAARNCFKKDAMKLFVDTGNVKEVETLAALGILDGVTTNPTLLSKESGDYREILKGICQIVKGPVSGEVVATDYAGIAIRCTSSRRRGSARISAPVRQP